MRAVVVIATRELRDALRNRWCLTALCCLGGLAVLLALLGAAPGGTVKAAPLVVSVASLSSLGVYLVPLLALMLSFDALVGEAERGTLNLLLTYPVARWQVIAGKFAGHAVTLTAAVAVGYGAAAVVIVARANNTSGWLAYLQMMAASVALGLVFIGLGYVISAVARERATAVASALAAWLTLVILYDLALLGALLLDEGQRISPRLFGALMLASPTDAYRVLTLSRIDAVGDLNGMAGMADAAALATPALLASLTAWIIGPLLVAILLFNRREP